MTISSKTYFQILEATKKIKGPALLFDLTKIEENMRTLSRLARRHRCRILMAAKSFPHREPLALAKLRLDGFDISNSQELRLLPRNLGKKLLWVSSPALDLKSLARDFQKKRCNTVISCGNTEQLKELEELFEGQNFAIRLNTTSFLKIPNRARVEGRFGFDSKNKDLIRSLIRSSKNHFVGFHFHHGFENNTTREYIKMAQVAAHLSRFLKKPLKYLNLGGGLVNLNENEIESMLRKIRKFIPRTTVLVFEPGRYLTKNAGFALAHCQCISRKEKNRFTCTLDISREAHLQWSAPILLSHNPTVKRRKSIKVEFVGSTCYEFDRFGMYSETPDPLCPPEKKYAKGTPVIFSNVSGYSVAWNRSFNGIPAARILFL